MSIYYATISDIRMKAGFEKATNLDDRYVRAARTAAQNEINTALADLYTTPFNPVPEKIRALTIKLAAYTLKDDAYQDVASSKALEALRNQLALFASGEAVITDDLGADLSTSEGVSGYFGEYDEPRMFTVDQRF